MGNMGDVAAKRIKIARKAVGLSQAELGDSLGVSRDAISKIENGRSSLTMSHLEILPKVLHRPVTYFLGVDPPSDLNEEEAQLVHIYRRLRSDADRANFLAIAEAFGGAYSVESE